MHKLLIINTFESAKKNEKLKGVSNPSKNYLSKILSDYISIEINFQIGERRLRDYYTEALNEINNIDYEINIAQLKVVLGLCKYLGYNDFQEFCSEEKNKKRNSKKKSNFHEKKTFVKFSRKNIILLFFATSIIIVLTIFLSKPRVMIWNDDHYKQVTFDLDKYNFSELKLYKKERITSFKKIIPNCDTTIFFNENGSANLWYGKSNNGVLEYFTDVGLHPETGKTLKAITNYMIDKYICVTN